MARNEATLEEWRDLYQLATFIGEMAPWEQFADVDLISVRFSEQSEPVYCSILGNARNTFGVVFYEGEKGLEDFIIMMDHQQIIVPSDYAMLRQTNLICFWGDRRELSPKQLKIIKDLGYKYRGKNSWLYFMSNRVGFYPFMPDREEVLKLTRFISGLIAALEYQKTYQLKIKFDQGELFDFIWDEVTEKRKGAAAKIPFHGFSMEQIQVGDMQLVSKLKKTRNTAAILEVDLIYLLSPIEDKEHGRPLNPQLIIFADHKTGAILKAEVCELKNDPEEALFQAVIDLILDHGKPRKILVRNRFVHSLIGDVCRVSGIDLTLQENLESIENFTGGLGLPSF